jgi:hypothetical protein
LGTNLQGMVDQFANDRFWRKVDGRRRAEAEVKAGLLSL